LQFDGMNVEKALDIVYTRRSVRIALHVLFWTALLLTQVYLASISFNNFRGWPQNRVFFNLLGGIICTIVFYYPFVYQILPQFIYKKKFWRGWREIFVWLIVFNLADIVREELVIKSCSACMNSLESTGYKTFLEKKISDRMMGKYLSLGSLIGLIFAIALPLCIKYGILFLRQQYLTMRMAKENLQLEFNFLRSQVNPHFLFNTMNNIYGLIMNNDKTKSLETVAGLTQFLRYSLYESNSDKVDIAKELQLLKNYIELESIRLNHIKVNFHDSDDGSVQHIAPLLFIPIIENTFKHTEDVRGATIDIEFTVKQKHITFGATNTVVEQLPANGKPGIGLINLQKRLNLYYPGKYAYSVTKDEHAYRVLINIKTHE